MQFNNPGNIDTFLKQSDTKWTRLQNEPLSGNDKLSKEIELLGERVSARLERASEFDVVFEYMKQPKIMAIYHKVSLRMYEIQ